MTWKETGSALKSDTEVTQLVHDVLQAPDFDIQDLSLFDASRHTSQLDTDHKSIPPEDLFSINKWKCMTVKISIPTWEKKKEGNGWTFLVDGLQYRPILNVLQAVFMEASSKSLHLMPFKKIWKSPVTSREQHVYDELYISDAWNQAQDKIMKQRRDNSCKLEQVIAGLMFWSDSTWLTVFRHASAWTVYLFFGNLSKYARANPQSGCCHPIAFMPSVIFLLLFLPVTDGLIISPSFQNQSRGSYPQSPTRKTTVTCWHTANGNLCMLSGKYYSTMISSRLTRMALL